MALPHYPTIKALIAILPIVLFSACEARQQENITPIEQPDTATVVQDSIAETTQEPEPFDKLRDTTALTNKIKNGKALVVHAFVPLCDNENQGIVPTSPSLGDGMNLSTNLYWATSYGMWKYFKNDIKWEYIYKATQEDYDSLKPLSEHVLMRAIYRQTTASGTTIYLVCDAYRGDRMEECLEDYFSALASGYVDTLTIYESMAEDSTLVIFGAGLADLIAFNGHNGLMDTYPEIAEGTGPTKDAVAIACISESFFLTAFEKTRSYPLVTTTSLLYPGAAVLDEIITAWANGENGEQCRLAAGQGYKNMKDKYSLEACQRMFSSGW